MDGGAWWATAHRVAKSRQTRLSTRALNRESSNLTGWSQQPEHTSEILWAWLQTTAIHTIQQQSESHDFFGFPMHIKAMFTPVCCLLSVQ